MVVVIAPLRPEVHYKVLIMFTSGRWMGRRGEDGLATCRKMKKGRRRKPSTLDCQRMPLGHYDPIKLVGVRTG